MPPLTLTRLTPLADTPLFAFFNQFLVACLQIVHITLPNFIGILPGPGQVHLMAIPHLTMLDASPGLVATLAPGHPVEQVTLHVARILYDSLHSGCAF